MGVFESRLRAWVCAFAFCAGVTHLGVAQEASPLIPGQIREIGKKWINVVPVTGTRKKLSFTQVEILSVFEVPATKDRKATSYALIRDQDGSEYKAFAGAKLDELPVIQESQDYSATIDLPVTESLPLSQPDPLFQVEKFYRFVGERFIKIETPQGPFFIVEGYEFKVSGWNSQGDLVILQYGEDNSAYRYTIPADSIEDIRQSTIEIDSRSVANQIDPKMKIEYTRVFQFNGTEAIEFLDYVDPADGPSGKAERFLYPGSQYEVINILPGDVYVVRVQKGNVAIWGDFLIYPKDREKHSDQFEPVMLIDPKPLQVDPELTIIEDRIVSRSREHFKWSGLEFPKFVDLSKQFQAGAALQRGGSCHIFAAVALAEAYCFRVFGTPIDFSEYYLFYRHLREIAPDRDFASWSRRGNSLLAIDGGAEADVDATLRRIRDREVLERSEFRAHENKFLRRLKELGDIIDSDLKDFLEENPTSTLANRNRYAHQAGLLVQGALDSWAHENLLRDPDGKGAVVLRSSNRDVAACLDDDLEIHAVPFISEIELVQILASNRPVYCSAKHWGGGGYHGFVVSGYRLHETRGENAKIVFQIRDSNLSFPYEIELDGCRFGRAIL